MKRFLSLAGILIILINAYQNLVTNAIKKVLLKIKHINKYDYRTNIEYSVTEVTEVMHIMRTCSLNSYSNRFQMHFFETKL